MAKPTYIIIIPYLPIACQGKELLYAIEGWRRHFKENYHIVVIGEGVHGLDAPDLTCINSERVKELPGQYRQHLDYVNCLRKVRKLFPRSKGFIMVADDCYAVKDFGIKDVKALKMLGPTLDFRPDSTNAWRRDKAKTKKVLVDEGLPTRNFTTHLPQYYEWSKWEAIVEKYHMDRESYVIEDLYYNTYFPDDVPACVKDPDLPYKLGVYSPAVTQEEIRRAIGEKIWITNSPEGWSPALVTELKRYFGF